MITNYSPITVGFELTTVCNLSCKHCPIESGNYGPSIKELREIILQIHKAFSKYHKLVFWFTGGEPCMRKELVCELSKEVSNLSIELNICTNGTFIDDHEIQNAFFNYYNKIFVSLDAPYNFLDPLRKGISSDEIWEKLYAFIKKRGEEARPEIIIKTTLSKWNIKDIDKLVRDAINIGVDHLEMRPIQKAKDHTKEIESYYLDFKDLSALKKCKQLTAKYPRFINFTDIYYEKVMDYIFHRLNPPEFCHAGVEHLFLTNDFNLLPCCAYYPRTDTMKLTDLRLALENYFPLDLKKILEDNFGKSFHSKCKECLFIQNYN